MLLTRDGQFQFFLNRSENFKTIILNHISQGTLENYGQAEMPWSKTTVSKHDYNYYNFSTFDL